MSCCGQDNSGGKQLELLKQSLEIKQRLGQIVMTSEHLEKLMQKINIRDHIDIISIKDADGVGIITGYCMQFDKFRRGEGTPKYQIRINKDDEVTFNRIQN